MADSACTLNPPGRCVVDWAAPWFQGWREQGAEVQARWSAGVGLSEALNQAAGAQTAPVRFVAQQELPDGVAYEAHIHRTRTCPTRDNPHDFFNGLCWLRFPLSKCRLNQLQAAEIQRQGVVPVRGALRDGLTLFDENAALLQAPDALWDALCGRDWTRLFVDLRPLWAQARLQLFGHALLEKLMTPYKSITAHVYLQRVPMALAADDGAWDNWLSGTLQAEHMASKPFTPLPVLGTPGWWPGNLAADFYDDRSVFRVPSA